MTSPAPIPVLLYHSVCDRAAPRFHRFTVSPARFARHLDAIEEAGFRSVTVSELLAEMDHAPPDDRPPIAITFDDGFADFFYDALPILNGRGMRSTVYISSGYVGATSSWLSGIGEGSRPMLSWGQIGSFGGQVEVGGHAHTHRPLDALSRSHARWEVEHGKEVLERRTGRRIEAFAYPHGYSDTAVRSLVRDADYTSATVANHALAHRDEDRFAISRIVVDASTTPSDLVAMCCGGLPTARPRERLRTRGWRAARRVRAAVTR